MTDRERYEALIAIHGASRVGAIMLDLDIAHPPADEDAAAWSAFVQALILTLNEDE